MSASPLQQLFVNAIQCQKNGQFFEAELLYRQMIATDPRHAAVHFNLGIVLRILGRHEEAIAAYRQSISLDPNFAEAWNNLGNALRSIGRLDEAINAFQRAINRKPDYVDALNNLGAALKDVGRLDEAIDCLGRAIALQPENAAITSNRLYALHYHPNWNAKKILTEAKAWNERYAAPLRGVVNPCENDRSTNRQLRIGYVSANFRQHCQAMFMLPLLANHDHEQFEIYCYSDVVGPDAVTERLRCLADQWRETARLSDEQLADLIRQDKVDVLVDLTLHMSNNRLLVFARKPAPVQVTWLGYPGTTGLAAIDYRLTDPFLDPPGEHDDYYVERSIRLPHTFWCYDPLSDQPVTNASPVFQNHHITFGCLNNFCKINDLVLGMWSKVLQAIKDSRLILLSPPGDHRKDLLRKLGISSDRVEFAEFQPREKYLELYHRIDIGLDTFPYNGHTTSLDALWMGVPVVSLCGETAVSRAGLSLLANLGLKELVASDPEMFVRIAVEHAADISRLATIRSGLRAKMQASPMMDARGFCRDIENEYRAMWRQAALPRLAARLRGVSEHPPQAGPLNNSNRVAIQENNAQHPPRGN